ncbi:MAG: PH domain-containing protein [Euryarchaeota archaeon]|nr:PH domain-containing protein [Euryarchaeota archaeon]
MTNPSPAIYRDPIFPRNRLTVGESLLWEGRPSSVVYFVQPLILVILTIIFGVILSANYGAVGEIKVDDSTWALIAILLVLMPISALEAGLLTMTVGLIAIAANIMDLFDDSIISFTPLLIALFALLYYYVIWKHTAFAITDRRVMTQYGVFNIRFGDTRHERISNVTVYQNLFERALGFGDIMFSTSGETGGIHSDHSGTRVDHKGAVRWEDVPQPFLVRKKAEEARVITPWYEEKTPVLPKYVPTAIHQTIPPIEAEERLIKLRELRDKNLISQEEYDAKRQDILSRI